MIDAPYTIRYSKRKGVRITVERDGSVVVSAPVGTSSEVVERIVTSRWPMVQRYTNHPQKYPRPRPVKEFVSGESLLYLGLSYPLVIVNEPTDGIRFEDRFYLGRNQQAEAPDLFRRWYQAQAKSFLPGRIAQFAQRLGVAFRRIDVAELNYRWGSCTPGDRLRFNWRLIKAPASVIDYVIVHELAHLLEPNHTPIFWNIVSVQLPSYAKARDWLRRNGMSLEVDF